MIYDKVTAVYFSPTRTSKKGVEEIAKTLNPKYESLDLTIVGKIPEKTTFEQQEFVVFGAPSYGGRLFKGSVEAFKTLAGNQTPCVITVTYGNRHYDDTLLELSDLVTSLGFIPVAAAALIGEHTFGEVQVGRPNEADLAEDEAFAKEIMDRLEEIKPVVVPGNFPYKDGGNGGGFRPSTLESCVQCGLCAKNCPMQAIDYQDVCSIDHDKCIACFRCIKSCPVQAKVCNSDAYLSFAEGFTKRLAPRRENEYFLK